MIEILKHHTGKWFNCRMCSHLVLPEDVVEHLETEKHKANIVKCVQHERAFFGGDPIQKS
jgi:hypothetical protein